jgi:hypothetical protein
MKTYSALTRQTTWHGPAIDDEEILAAVPVGLFELLRELNGFIVTGGTLHLRGACAQPEWHSLRAAWEGGEAFHRLYAAVSPGEIPFAQDCFGDQFLLREGAVLRLFAETGEMEEIAGSLDDFLSAVQDDIEGYLNVQRADLAPGQLILAYPPFCVEGSESEVGLSNLPAIEVIRFHATVAKQLRDVPEGARIKFNVQ